jgi:hypothetical protein
MNRKLEDSATKPGGWIQPAQLVVPVQSICYLLAGSQVMDVQTMSEIRVITTPPMVATPSRCQVLG